MCQRAQRLLGDRPRLDRRRQRRFDQAEPVLSGDRTPAIPAQHRGSVEQHDPLRLRLGGGLQEHLGAGAHCRQRVAGAFLQRPGRDPLRQLDLDPLVDRGEQLALVVEVVVEGAAGDAGGAHDLLRADPGVAALGKQRACRRDQCLAGRLRALSLGPFDIHTVCM